MRRGGSEGLELHTPEYERRIAETLADRRPSRQEALERAERRERIATAALLEFIRRGDDAFHAGHNAEYVTRRLEEWLDRRRDADETEAR